ncbi:MAG: hypothetical protein ABSC18_03160 [Verrucomicrobiota bacterium]
MALDARRRVWQHPPQVIADRSQFARAAGAASGMGGAPGSNSSPVFLTL